MLFVGPLGVFFRSHGLCFLDPMHLFQESWTIFWDPIGIFFGSHGLFFGTLGIFLQDSWAIFVGPLDMFFSDFYGPCLGQEGSRNDREP